MRLAGKVALITGGGTGIGRAVATRFAEQGATVIVAGRRPAPLAAVVDAIGAAGGRAHAITADVSQVDDAARLVQKTVAQAGRLDVLVNNAGIITSRAPVGACTDEDFTRTLDGNLLSVFRLTTAALDTLKGSRGSVVNIASVAGLKGRRGLLAYATAKAGVVSLTRSMSLDLAPFRVRVNAVCPAYVETDLNRDFLAELKRTGGYEDLLAMHPLGLGTPDDVAWAVVYLASDEARWVTGVALPVDGGVMA
ncbi:MAG: glucose 1-dehydrogenase [Candidatus Rokubacteria bacterium]|nr:glucose 1-dehydrogenase [Candidatus Rokubacteria bacterium]